jgi:hypothetical protein
MCRLVHCPTCYRYRVSGCGDEEHEEEQRARIPPGQECTCQKQQMVEFEASVGALPSRWRKGVDP